MCIRDRWERYANNAAGVAIEFDVAKFERAMQFNSQMLRCITYIQGDVVKEEIDVYKRQLVQLGLGIVLCVVQCLGKGIVFCLLYTSRCV